MRIDGQRIRELRESRGQTQAAFARSCGLGESTIKYWESEKSKRVLPGTVFQVAARLGIPRDQLLAQSDSDTSLQELPRFLDQQVFPCGPTEVLDAMREAAIADMKSDFKKAHLRYEQALEAIGNRDAAAKAQLLVRYMTSLDNSTGSERAARVLEKELKQPMDNALAFWARYHLALAYRRMAERSRAETYLDEAEKILREVKYNGDAKQRVAAVHQLGCVFLVRAARECTSKPKTALLRKARGCFKSAAGRWRNMENFREGYSLRRLAEICEQEGRQLDAHRDLLSALEVFARHDCYRYAGEVRAHIEALARRIAGGRG